MQQLTYWMRVIATYVVESFIHEVSNMICDTFKVLLFIAELSY